MATYDRYIRIIRLWPITCNSTVVKRILNNDTEESVLTPPEVRKKAKGFHFLYESILYRFTKHSHDPKWQVNSIIECTNLTGCTMDMIDNMARCGSLVYGPSNTNTDLPPLGVHGLSREAVIAMHETIKKLGAELYILVTKCANNKVVLLTE